MKSALAVAAVGVWVAVGFGQNLTDPAEAYRKDLAVNPSSSLAHFRMGELLVDRKNLTSAANEFRSALNGDLQPRWTDIWSHVLLGRIYADSGKGQRAEDEYRLALGTGDSTQSGAREEANEYLLSMQRQNVLAPVGIATPLPPPFDLLSLPSPGYSDEARIAELEGTVVITGVRDGKGHATELQVTRGLGLGLDERALEAVRQARFTPMIGVTTVPVDFSPVNKDSRWHLVGVEFRNKEGASRPRVLAAYYPSGPGVFGEKAVEEGRLLGGIGRQAFVALSFEVNESGVPVRIQVQSTSDDVWNSQAIAVLREWRFAPGMKEGKPVPVSATFDFIWGPRRLPANDVAPILSVLHPPPPASGEARLPVIINRVVPAYVGMTGTVTATLTVSEDGTPRDIRVTNGLGPAIDSGVVAALGGWRFQPSLLNGEPASIPLVVRVTFELPNRVTSAVSRPPIAGPVKQK